VKLEEQCKHPKPSYQIWVGQCPRQLKETKQKFLKTHNIPLQTISKLLPATQLTQTQSDALRKWCNQYKQQFNY